VGKVAEKCCPDLPPRWLKQVARLVAGHVHHQLAGKGPRSQAPPHRTRTQNLIKEKSVKTSLKPKEERDESEKYQ
jgi:hypothetical protein